MKTAKPLKVHIQISLAAMVVTGLMGALASDVYSDEPKSDLNLKTSLAPVPTNSVVTKEPVIKRQLTGAELYSINCNRCHPERAPGDWTGAQWKTIMLQMQVRANIPAKQAKLILQYLQDNSGR